MERSKTVLTTTVFVMNPQRTHILLKFRNKPEWHGWAAPGGHVDFPESFADCARREVREETGFCVDELRFFAVSHGVGLGDGVEYLVFNYLCQVPMTEPHPMAGEAPCQWFALKDLPSMNLSDGMKERLELIASGGTAEEYVRWLPDGTQERFLLTL